MSNDIFDGQFRGKPLKPAPVLDFAGVIDAVENASKEELEQLTEINSKLDGNVALPPAMPADVPEEEHSDLIFKRREREIPASVTTNEINSTEIHNYYTPDKTSKNRDTRDIKHDNAVPDALVQPKSNETEHKPSVATDTHDIKPTQLIAPLAITEAQKKEEQHSAPKINDPFSGFKRDSRGRLRREDGTYASKKEKVSYAASQKKQDEAERKRTRQDDDGDHDDDRSVIRKIGDLISETVNTENAALDVAGTAAGGSYWKAGVETYNLSKSLIGEGKNGEEGLVSKFLKPFSALQNKLSSKPATPADEPEAKREASTGTPNTRSIIRRAEYQPVTSERLKAGQTVKSENTPAPAAQKSIVTALSAGAEQPDVSTGPLSPQVSTPRPNAQSAVVAQHIQNAPKVKNKTSRVAGSVVAKDRALAKETPRKIDEQTEDINSNHQEVIDRLDDLIKASGGGAGGGGGLSGLMGKGLSGLAGLLGLKKLKDVFTGRRKDGTTRRERRSSAKSEKAQKNRSTKGKRGRFSKLKSVFSRGNGAAERKPSTPKPKTGEPPKTKPVRGRPAKAPANSTGTPKAANGTPSKTPGVSSNSSKSAHEPGKKQPKTLSMGRPLTEAEALSAKRAQSIEKKAGAGVAAKAGGSLAEKTGGKLATKLGVKAAAKGILRFIPIIGTAITAGMDAAEGYTDEDSQRQTFGLTDEQAVSSKHRGSYTAANVLDMGGLVSGGSGLLAAGAEKLGMSKVAEALTFETGDIAKNISNMASYAQGLFGTKTDAAAENADEKKAKEMGAATAKVVKDGMKDVADTFFNIADMLGLRTLKVGELIQQAKSNYLGTGPVGNYTGAGVTKGLKNDTKVEEKLSKFDGLYEKEGKNYNIDPLLLRAQTKQESGGDHKAVSYAGAGGLMQIMPDTASDLGVTDRFNPEQSVAGGAKYMSQLKKKYKGDTALALAAYNAGPGNIDKARKKAKSDDIDAVLNQLPDVTGPKNAKQTQDYVRNILRNYNEYQEQAKASGITSPKAATNTDSAPEQQTAAVAPQQTQAAEQPSTKSIQTATTDPTAPSSQVAKLPAENAQATVSVAQPVSPSKPAAQTAEAMSSTQTPKEVHTLTDLTTVKSAQPQKTGEQPGKKDSIEVTQKTDPEAKELFKQMNQNLEKIAKNGAKEATTGAQSERAKKPTIPRTFSDPSLVQIANDQA
ncbi:MAG TPA: transglycosylase SLT domain-containing protein [Buttiauxella sp.]|jgi:hypothetical protein